MRVNKLADFFNFCCNFVSTGSLGMDLEYNTKWQMVMNQSQLILRYYYYTVDPF